MNVDKAKKRIAKYVKRGFKGYPIIAIEYFGVTQDSASQVRITFTQEEGAEPQEQTFESQQNAREDETIQSLLVKIIDRAETNTVTEVEGISLISS